MRGLVRVAVVASVLVLGVLGLFIFDDVTSDAPLAIVSGSENKELEPIIERWGAREGVDVTVTYRGSVDIARILEEGAAGEFDAVWPANSLWIALGDTQKVVKHTESILRSPVVLGLKRSIAEDLGWIGRDDVTVEEIARAAEAGRFRLAMTSATQSNSGASAYFGFLHAFAGEPDVLTLDDLGREEVRDATRALLRSVDRSSGSSGWLETAFVENPDHFDAMINYEALMIEANRHLVARDMEPLYVVYPANGMAVADSPLGFVAKGDPEKEEAFLKLQNHLLSKDVQAELQALGRRASLIGMGAGSDTNVWNPEWGIDTERAIAPIPTPSAEVIREALRLYQTDLRKPSLTVWLLDISGSMEGPPLDQLKEAMGLLFDPETATLNLLQPSRQDISIVIPFNGEPTAVWRVEGDEPQALAEMVRRVRGLEAYDGTDVYAAGMEAVRQLQAYADRGELFDYLPAIIAMTDGASDTTNRAAFLRMLADTSFGRDIPIHAIAFGEADEAQLEELNAKTVGRLFDARDDLAKALRSAKGYN